MDNYHDFFPSHDAGDKDDFGPFNSPTTTSLFDPHRHMEHLDLNSQKKPEFDGSTSYIHGYASNEAKRVYGDENGEDADGEGFVGSPMSSENRKRASNTMDIAISPPKRSKSPMLKMFQGLITELQVTRSKFYLVDSGYPNRLGYLAPYKGTKYHLLKYRQGPMPRDFDLVDHDENYVPFTKASSSQTNTRHGDEDQTMNQFRDWIVDGLFNRA
ncbi:hypothetical protein GUJ93_ZPchr0010g7439 [Zizania palustris]|uniref:DDE Tnp4 domain-containing protein n=1 Tax=Zizania palustris TaxID=103762 RepID=A0A8J5W7L7_ZIZPA|nr:hypothetical protein GUJ93_ZPchr0010g7439 [Zizania palustris]